MQLDMDVATLRKHIPEHIRTDPRAEQAWIALFVEQVEAAYALLEPETTDTDFAWIAATMTADRGTL